MSERRDLRIEREDGIQVLVAHQTVDIIMSKSLTALGLYLQIVAAHGSAESLQSILDHLPADENHSEVYVALATLIELGLLETQPMGSGEPVTYRATGVEVAE